MDALASQFFKVALETEDYNEKVLCINNVFFCIYGKTFASVAASVCGIDEKTFLDAVEYCREDSDSPRVLLSKENISALMAFLSDLK